VIGVPIAYLYRLWWPWVMNYHGEGSIGYYNIGYVKYLWLDQALKKQILGR